ncbi:hypothetical protein O3P69_010244 [Scylla paramamosain]|uniref:Uncharacterized protein n=1 Tax=Scylla paramamosain TaxID=85552 RepID=A0AAW0TRL4_SCYPA
MKVEKRKLLVVEKQESASATKRRCVVDSEGGRDAIVKRDLSSLVPLKSEECGSDGEELAFLNKNETGLVQLFRRLETSRYCSFIDVEDASDAGNSGAKEVHVRFFEPLLVGFPSFYVFSEHMSIDGFDTAVRSREKNRGGVVKENLFFDIKHNIRPLHKCRKIHYNSTLRPTIELSLGKDFLFGTAVLSIFNRVLALANAEVIGRPTHDNVIDEFSPAGYTVLAQNFIVSSIRKKTTSIPDEEERELKYLKKRAFATDSINTAIDAICYIETGYSALVWIVRNAFRNNEDGKKVAFMRMIRNTTKEFGILRECIERESSAFYEILALPNVRATINCRYRYYGNAPAPDGRHGPT